MKIEGHDFSRPSIEIVVIPRGFDEETGEALPDIIFHCRPVKDYGDFEINCKEPSPPSVIKPGGVKEENYEDENYKKDLAKFGRRRYDYMVIQSLKATRGLSWDKVKEGEHKTWYLWEEELREAGFTEVELGIIQRGILNANSLSKKRLDEALANFQLGLVAQ